jgi:flagellar protein FliO/FliZ
MLLPLTLASTPLWAAQSGAAPVFAFGELLKLVLALVLTIGLFFILAVFMKKMQYGTGRANNLIHVLAALPLGSKEKIYVLDIAGERIVVGTSAGNISRLHILASGAGEAEASLPEAHADVQAEAKTPAAGFATLLRTFTGGQKS